MCFFLTILHRIGLAGLFLLSPAAWAQGQEGTATQRDSPQQHFQSAQTFQIAGDYERAASEYRETIARGLQRLGNLRVSLEDYSGGIDLLGKAVEIAPNFLEARVDLGIAKFKADDLEAAKAEAQAALAKKPDNIRALNLVGKIQFMQGDFQAAADSLESALRLQPDFDVAYTLALTDLELKKPVPAGVLFDEMLASSKASANLQALIGIAYRETGYLDQAVSHLKKAVTLDPQSSRVHSALGLAHFLKGPPNYATARKEFLAGLAIDSDDHTCRYYLGIIAAAENNLAEAAKWLKQAAAARPGDPDVYFRLGQVQFDAGHFEDATVELRKWLALTSHDQNTRPVAQVHELLGKALERLGRRSEAEAEFTLSNNLREQPQGGPEESTMQRPERAQSAQQELRSMLLQVPKRAAPPGIREEEYVKQISALLGEAYDNLSVIDARAGRYANATAGFNEAAHWNPRIQGLDRKWGIAAFRAKQYDQAISPLARQMRQTPHDLVLRETLGVCYFMADKFSEAATIFMPALDALSDNPGVLYAAGVSLARIGNNRDASKLFSRMLKRNPFVPQVHLLLGEAHSDLSEYGDALTELSRALELDPKLGEAHYYKGIVHFKQGRMDDAAREFQAELALNTASAPAIYQLAVVRASQGETDEAIQLLTQVLKQSPSNADAHYQLGKIMLDKGDLKTAIENLEAAVHIEPRDYSCYQLSLAYRRDGRMREAQQVLQMYEHLKRKP
jgi:tetratricopeptide (TPR) repeat protein